MTDNIEIKQWNDLQSRVYNQDPPPRLEGTLLEERSVATMRIMEKYSRPVQKGLIDLTIDYDINRKTRICLAMCPEWDPGFPPYNIAKLAGVCKTAGYACKSFDLNVEAFNDYKKNKWDVHYNPWDGPRDWHWIGEQYWKELHFFMKPILDQKIQEIIDFNPDVVGFSLYYCNEEPTDYMVTELKRLLPSCKILIGGPSTHYSYFKPKENYDYVINGEGEQPLLKLLNEIEQNKPVEYSEEKNNTLIIRQAEDARFNLSTLPFPDYTDFDFTKYSFANGALCAISRGCTAKCTFCEETHYYKYRQRTAVSTLEEVEHMYYTYGTDVFYFTDSLVNGNLHELRSFAEGIKAKGLKIHWTGYARCDGRMDLEYYQALRDSGCRALNYGTESGAQEVLDGMDKRVTIKEMEDNFRDGHAVGIDAMTNWIVGFPNETPRMFEDSLTFLWRQRNLGLLSIGQGTGFSVGVDTIVGQNLAKFDLLDVYYYDHWVKKDFTATIVHKLIKMKTFSIFTDLLVTKKDCGRPTRRNLAKFHYTIEFIDPTKLNEIDYEYKDFDYNIIKPCISGFADSLVNEIWPLLRIVWRTRGGYKFKLLFKPEWEYAEWGARNAAPLNAEYLFEIDDAGNWTADFKWDYEQSHKDYEWQDGESWFNQATGKMEANYETWGPVWGLVDFTQDASNAAARARKLAWKNDPKFKDADPWNAWDIDKFVAKKHEFAKFRNLDLSFKYDWQGSGKWNG
tara:strand:- start:9905 stop:12109 length:2205 start_codon:yes stop_codon:yes gene_type:complete